MRIPLTPPAFHEIWAEAQADSNWFTGIAPPQTTWNGDYIHWDKLVHLEPPDGLTHRRWWFSIKAMRRFWLKSIPLTDRFAKPFTYSVTDTMYESLHKLDMAAGGLIPAPHQITNPAMKDRYFVNSLMEEAITSSQIEGAATTHLAAKEMLRTGRPPMDRSEQMIVNNYQTMRRITEIQREPLSKELIFEIHRLITQGTLNEPDAAGRFRRHDEDIVVHDHEGTILHRPPRSDELKSRMHAMCKFANGETPDHFLHPALRSMMLHFWLAHDHPFVDGNGRTARALFYWSMLHYGFWLFEFISISTVINKARVQYSQAYLLTETDENDLTYFLLYHTRVIERAIQALYDYLERKAAEVRALEARLGEADLNSRQRALMGHALRHPGFRYTIGSHQNSHNVSYQTARTDLMGMAEAGLLVMRKEGKAFHFTPAADLEERLTRKGRLGRNRPNL